jgi:hypothetical protein
VASNFPPLGKAMRPVYSLRGQTAVPR